MSGGKAFRGPQSSGFLFGRRELVASALLSTANAQTVSYALPSGATAGKYGSYIIDGTFRNTTDTHVFAFTPPADTK